MSNKKANRKSKGKKTITYVMPLEIRPTSTLGRMKAELKNGQAKSIVALKAKTATKKGINFEHRISSLKRRLRPEGFTLVSPREGFLKMVKLSAKTNGTGRAKATAKKATAHKAAPIRKQPEQAQQVAA